MPERDPIERLNEALEGLSIPGQSAPDREIHGNSWFLVTPLRRQ